ncbi:MAG: Gfo/Idh/MocA family oxidoreductase [Opitutaceae bacterium]
MNTELVKFFRFWKIYGFRRTFYKAAARSRHSLGFLRPHGMPHRDIGIIGCGQFAFATIGCIICQKIGNRFIDCFDPNKNSWDSFANFFRVKHPSIDAEALIHNPEVKLVFVVSNHASHADYAIMSLNAGKRVYIEKPLIVTSDQARRLFAAIRRVPERAFAGYNRPHSAAINSLHALAQNTNGPWTINCTVLGHVLPLGHWYRDSGEGTRICGNVGHWLDLAVHVLCWNKLPVSFDITVAYSDSRNPDDDISIVLTTPHGDLVSITLTSRGEPFEGINETIVMQRGELIAKIDDFRTMHWWKGELRGRNVYYPKDVGHSKAIMQPFSDKRRDWIEVEISTLLMLEIADMVRAGETRKLFVVMDAMNSIGLSMPGENPAFPKKNN